MGWLGGQLGGGVAYRGRGVSEKKDQIVVPCQLGEFGKRGLKQMND